MIEIKIHSVRDDKRSPDAKEESQFMTAFPGYIPWE